MSTIFDSACHINSRENSMSSKGPNLKSYLDKTVNLQLSKGRKVSGILRGYDQFMNIVLDSAIEESTAPNVKSNTLGSVVIRGNSIVQFELLR